MVKCENCVYTHAETEECGLENVKEIKLEDRKATKLKIIIKVAFFFFLLNLTGNPGNFPTGFG